MRRPVTNAMRGPVGRGRRLAILTSMILTAVLAGCSVDPEEFVGSVPDDYRIRHKIVLEEALAIFEIPVGPESERLAPAMHSNIAAFGNRFRSSGSSVLAIVTPHGAPNAGAAQRIAGEIRQVLVASGVSQDAISLRSYSATSDDPNAPVRLAYNRIAGVINQCGDWPEELGWNPANRNYENFGCATQQNLAAIVDNPLDLVYPRDGSPPDAGRRGTVVEKYRIGEQYQTDYGRESKTTLSGAGG